MDTDSSAQIVAFDIENTCVRDICISNTYTMGTWIGYADIESACTGGIYITNVFVRSVEPRILVGLGVILIRLRVNNYCL